MRRTLAATVIGMAVFASLHTNAQETVGATVKTLRLEDGQTYEMPSIVRCKDLVVAGTATLIASGTTTDVGTDPSSIQVGCESVTFESGAVLETWSNLILHGDQISGNVAIVGLRNRAGDDGAPITESSDKLDGADGTPGASGGNGRDAKRNHSARAGGNGSNGGNGAVGADGSNGAPGGTGEFNVNIELYALNFDGLGTVVITSDGGVGGKGSDGQDGGHGGNGGAAGNGGNGGAGNDWGHDARRGGDGGNGGNGGDGGGGGNGGDGGAGGNGGKIVVLISEDENGRGIRPASATLENFGGEGGQPGVHGLGGKGGNGGSPGAGGTGGDGGIWHADDPNGNGGRPGAPGKRGEDGDDGAWGAKGKKGEVIENVIGYGHIDNPPIIDWGD